MLPDIIKSAGMTALWEQALDEIAQGQSSLVEFMAKQEVFIQRMVEGGKTDLLNVMANNQSMCPKCSGIMIKRKGRYGVFLSCSSYQKCKEIMSLPAKIKD